MVVVSTGGLLTQEEMNLWNFVAKRLSAPSDATDFWGVPSFYESVNRRMELLTDIVPRHSPRIRWMQATTRQPYASEGWWGVVFDEPVPTAYDQWETYTLRGRVTESEATHVRFDGQTVDDNYSGTYSFFLKEPVGDDGRFSVTFQFRAAGSYMLSTRLSKVDGEDVLSSRTGILVSARARPALGAKIRPPSTIRAGLRVVFDGSGSEGAESYSWDFGDGTVIEHPNVVSRPSHTYVEPGSYEVRLEVARGGDCGSQLCEYDTAMAMVDVLPRPLTARLVTQSTVEAGMAVVFDGSGSVGAESYRWDFGDGTEIEHPNVVSRPSHTYVEPGSYEVRLEVARGGDCGHEYCETETATAMLEVEAGALPAARFDLDTDCSDELCVVRTDSRVTFRDLTSGTVAGRSWDFGDGVMSSEAEATHSWSSPGFYRVVLTASGLGATSMVSRDILVRASDPAGTCEPNAETLCLKDSRYELRVDWWTGAGESGTGSVVHAGTNDSGLFRFFDADNWEILIKVLDGCALNGRVWVYGASTTDQGYSIRVTDTVSGEFEVYRNEAGRPAPAITDNEAFSAACQEGASAVAGSEADGADGLPGFTLEPLSQVSGNSGSGCTGSDSSLCLADGRFEVTVDWSTADGKRGPASTISVGTNNSGLFYFFDPGNWEMLIKVLDGCAFNDHHWVYAASATDQGLDITVTDTATGEMWTHSKAPGQPAPAITASEAFPDSCSR